MLSWDHHDIHYVTFILHVVLTLENNKFGVPKILKINIKLSNVFELQDVNWDINLIFSSQTPKYSSLPKLLDVRLTDSLILIFFFLRPTRVKVSRQQLLLMILEVAGANR